MDKKISTTASIGSLLAFGALGLEIILNLLDTVIYGNFNIFAVSLRAVVIHFSIVFFIWISSIILIHLWTKRKGLDIFSYREPIPAFKMISAVLVTLIFIGLYILLRNSTLREDMRATRLIEYFKPYIEHRSFTAYFGGKAIIASIMQTIYYVLEIALVTTIIAMGQKASDINTGKTQVPWGGITLALTWGIAHLLTMPVLTGLIATAMSVVFGLFYLLTNRNLIVTYLLILLIFLV